jgi:hypothetical protein
MKNNSNDLNGRRTTFLSQVILANGLFSTASGVGLMLGASPLGPFLGVEAPGAYRILGLVLVLFGLDLLWLSRRRATLRPLTRVVIALDLSWVIVSLVLLLTGWLPFTTAGQWTVALLADVVAVFAVLQYVGLRRLGRAAGSAGLAREA